MFWRIAVFLILFHILSAAPVGNPGTPGLMHGGLISSNPWFKATTGYLADYVSDLRLDLSSGSSNVEQLNPDKTFSKFGLHSQMASFSLVFLQRLEAYALLGGTKEHLKWHDEPKTPFYSALFEFQTTYHFSWAAGLRVILLQWGQTFFSFDGSYFVVPQSHKAYFKFLNRLNLNLEEGEQSFYLREWQTGVALASRFWIFTPYAGLKYFNAKLHIQSGPETTALNYHNKKSLGYYYGLTLGLTSKLLVTFERRVVDEFAYMFSTVAVF